MAILEITYPTTIGGMYARLFLSLPPANQSSWKPSDDRSFGVQVAAILLI